MPESQEVGKSKLAHNATQALRERESAHNATQALRERESAHNATQAFREIDSCGSFLAATEMCFTRSSCLGLPLIVL